MAKKILVVDDDPAVVKTLIAILEHAGYEVIVAGNGEECAKRIIFENPDLILLDIMMSLMDGYTFLIAIKELKEMQANIPDIPVIVITGREDAQVKELVGKENIKDYLLKPFDITVLLEKIKHFLGEG